MKAAGFQLTSLLPSMSTVSILEVILLQMIDQMLTT